MRTRAFLLALIVWLAPAWASAQVLDTGTITAASTSCLATNCVDQALAGIETVAIGVQGTFVGTIEVEVSNDRELTWAAWTVLQQTDRTLDEEITTTGLWLGGNAGYTHMRVRASAWTSGSASITLTRGLGGVSVPLTSTAGGDGAIQDGTSAAIEATVKDYLNSNPLMVGVSDANGDLITSFGGGTQYAVDAALGSTPTGTLGLAIRDDALSTLTPVEGDAVGLRVDSTGALWVSTGAAQPLLDDPIFADDAAFTLTSSKVTMAGAIKDAALSALAAADTDAVPLRTNSLGALWTASEGIGTTTDAESGPGQDGSVNAKLKSVTSYLDILQSTAFIDTAAFNGRVVAGGGMRDDVLSSLSAVEGAMAPLRLSANGALWVTSTGDTLLSLIDDPIFVDDAAFTLTSSKVQMAGCIVDAALSALAASDTDAVPCRVDATGAQWVIPSGTTIVGDGAGSLNTIVDSGTITTVSTVTSVTAVTNLATIGTSITPGTSAAHLGKAVDNVAGGSDVGVALLAVRDDALATLTPVDGDYTNLRVNASGALHVTGAAGVSEFNEDTAHSSGAAGNLGLAVRNDAGTALAGDGDYIPLQVNSAGALFVTGGGGGVEYVTNDVAAANPTGATFVMERDDALSALTEVEGDWTNPRASANGALWVSVDGSVTVGTVSTVTSVTAIATSVTPGTSAAHLGKAVDAVAGASDTGVLALAVRDDTLGTLTPVDGDYTQLRVNSQGALHVTGATATTQFAEDVAHVSGDSVVFLGAIRRDTTPTSSAGLAGDYTAINADANGRLYTNSTLYDSAGAALTLATDMTIGTAVGTTGPGAMLVYSDFDGAAIPTLTNVDTEGEAVLAAASIKGVQYVMVVSEDGALERGTATTPTIVGDGTGALNVICDSGCAGGTQYAEDAIHASGNTGTLGLAVRNDAGTALAADGDNIPLMVNSAGALFVAGTVTVTDGAGALNVIVDSGTVTTVSTVTAVTTVSTLTTLSQLGGVALPVEDLAETAGGVGIYAMGVRRDVAAASTATSGDNTMASYDAVGALWTRTTDPCSGPKTIKTISITADTELFTGTASTRTYICHINLVSATAQNIAVISGTGTICATSTGPLFGGTTAATGWNFAINGGIAAGNGAGTIAKSDTDADNICIDTSSSGQISGVITYVVAPN